MNDAGYIDIDYKDSHLYRSLTHERKQLEYQRSYTLGAIEFHKRDQNPKQVVFFQEHIEEIDKRLARLKEQSFGKWMDGQWTDIQRQEIDKQTLRKIFEVMYSEGDC